MYCTRKVNEDIHWVGGNDRRLAMFEGVYSIPDGVSYNSYLILDEKTILFDTVDRAVGKVFFENVAHVLGGRKLDYVVVHHMEPDHSATLMDLLCRYTDTKIVCTKKTSEMIQQFFAEDVTDRAIVVKENDTLSTGKHEFQFIMAPMVHWPEVMFTYDKTDKVLFSADAFGTFNALNGALFADELDFYHTLVGEARRYYANIIGKYGPQVQSALKKIAKFDIKTICPLHGPVHRRDFAAYIDKYHRWSSYEPEETGVMLAYASIYGNTENAAEILASRLRELGVKVEVFDVSVVPMSEIVAAAFRYSHLVFAATTYNAGVFITMEDLIHDLALHNIQNRTLAFIENGSWAPVSGKLMRETLEPLKDMVVLEQTVSLRSSLKEEQMSEIDALAKAIADTMTLPKNADVPTGDIDNATLFAISYGLFVLTAKDGEKDNGCIINTVIQATSTPLRVTFTVNKSNLTHDMLLKTGIFNLSILTESSTFDLYQRFGIQSGRETDKFADFTAYARSVNGVTYVTEGVNALLSGKVIDTLDCGTHTLFLADLTEARKLSKEPSVTYEYYRRNIKPKPSAEAQKKKGWLCTVCGYIYEGEVLPPDYICPVCKHGAEVFVPLDSIAEDKKPEPEQKPEAEPKPQPEQKPEPVQKAEPSKKKRWLCTVCGYIYEGEELPPDYICPVCHNGAEVFVPIDEDGNPIPTEQ
ncbi:MAG: MBL fold metallo-hydrolase [Clostridiales bacterium]|nr:MBL fold metallo-hydrolase [Clostridiales bacterium]